MNIAAYTIGEMVLLGISVYVVAAIFVLLYIASNIGVINEAIQRRNVNGNIYKVLSTVFGILLMAWIIATMDVRIGWAFWFDGVMMWMIVRQIIVLADANGN
jgi:hypothetical protein